MSAAKVRGAIAAGAATAAAVDDAVLRILTAMYAVGVMDEHAADPGAYGVAKHKANASTPASDRTRARPRDEPIMDPRRDDNSPDRPPTWHAIA